MTSPASSQDLTALVVDSLANVLKIDKREIRHDLTFDALGLDSAGAFKFAGALNGQLGTDHEPTILYEHPTVTQLVEFLSGNGSKPSG